MSACCGNDKKYQIATKFYCHSCLDNEPCLACEKTLLDEEMWNDIPGRGETCNELSVKHLDGYPEPVINLLNPEQFHEHYQELAPTREEQKQCLKEINTRLCDHCLILCNFQYCNECDFIYNPPSYMIYTIPKEDKPINSYAVELKSTFNSDLNSDNNDNKNNAQLVPVRNREKLGITAKRIQEFRSMGRIDVLVNMAEKEIINKGEIISTYQPISIPSYDQYMVVIEKKVKYQVQIFETEAALCESEKIGLINLHIPAKNHSHIKIPIYNNTENVIRIPERTTIGYLTTEIENQLPDIIPDFPQLCGYVDITSQTIYG
ncbi:hypothetical protein G9A89_018429 [Geosiphon pyriformis]|nr:hypothetical protein G9A89_018429 [Geosiphon pyriformis]